MAYIGKNPNLASTVLDDKGVASVPNPPAGKVRIINRDGVLISQSDAGVEEVLGAGAGGGINYFVNGSFETSISEGVVSANGSLINSNTAETTNPLFGSQSCKLTTQSASTGEIDFNITGIDEAVTDGAFALLVTGYFKTDGNDTEGDWKVGIYQFSGGKYVSEQLSLVPGAVNVFRAPFVPEAGETYHLRVEFDDTTSGRAVVVDKLTCTPDSNSGLIAFEQKSKVVNNAVLDIINASSALTNPPSSITNDDAVKGIAYVDSAGDWRLRFNVRYTISPTQTTTQFKFAGVTISSTHTWAVAVANESGDTLQAVTQTANQNIIGSGNTSTNWQFSGDIPIEGKPTWFDANVDNNKVNLLTQDVISANARARYNISSSTGIGSGTIDFDTEVYNVGFTDNGSGEITIPADGDYRIAVSVSYSTSRLDAGANIRLLKNDSVEMATSYQSDDTGSDFMGRHFLIYTEARLVKGDFINVTQNGSAAQTFKTADGDTYLTISRISQYGAFEPVGFALATDTQAGLVKKNKYEVKEATAGDITVTGDVAALQINNLEIGKTYQIDLSGVANYPASGESKLELHDNVGTSLRIMQWFKNVGGSTINLAYSHSFFFTPAIANEQTLKVNVSVLAASASYEGGTSTSDRLRLRISETNHLVAGTF